MTKNMESQHKEMTQTSDKSDSRTKIAYKLIQIEFQIELGSFRTLSVCSASGGWGVNKGNGRCTLSNNAAMWK